MTTETLPDWLILSVAGLSADAYAGLPEEICRRIEVVDGAIVVLPSPCRAHQHIVLRVANALESACGPELAVVFGADLRLRDQPLLNRRPDVVVYDATVPDDAVLRPEHCTLVVEVMALGSRTTDQIHKPAEYAAAGIEHFWRIEPADDGTLAVFRYRLDSVTRSYVLADLT